MSWVPARWLWISLALGAAAWAQEPAPAVPPPPAESKVVPPATPPVPRDVRVHVRGSHTVDVIAPGEKVETIIDRMRANRPAPPPTGRGPTAPRPPAVGPEGKRPVGPEGKRPVGPPPKPPAPLPLPPPPPAIAPTR